MSTPISHSKGNDSRAAGQVPGRRKGKILDRRTVFFGQGRLGRGQNADTERVRQLVSKHHPVFDEAARVMFIVALLELGEAPLAVVYSFAPLPDGEDCRVPSSRVARSVKSMGLVERAGCTVSPLTSCNSGWVTLWRLADREVAVDWLRVHAPWVVSEMGLASKR